MYLSNCISFFHFIVKKAQFFYWNHNNTAELDKSIVSQIVSRIFLELVFNIWYYFD